MSIPSSPDRRDAMSAGAIDIGQTNALVYGSIGLCKRKLMKKTLKKPKSKQKMQSKENGRMATIGGR